MTKNPILIDMPMPIRTERLIITPAFPDKLDEYAEKFYNARMESIEELKPWMEWAHEPTSVEDNKIRLVKWYANYILREDFCFVILTHENEFVATAGLHRIDWKVPRAEIGYWCRTSMTGKGYVTELSNALTRYAFDVMGMRKVTIEMDKENTASENVAKRLNFIHEFDDIAAITKPGCDDLRTRRVYGCYDPKTLPALTVSW